MAQVLLTSEVTDDQRDCLLTLRNSGTHLLALLNDLLDISQIEAGHLKLVQDEFDLQGTARDVVDVLSKEAEKKGIRMGFDTMIAAQSTFVGDSDRVRQIVFNLLGNSVKFTGEGGSVTLRMAAETRDNGKDGVLIEVIDTGVGMTPDQKKIIFQEFTQASVETRNKYGGTGLGLAISLKLVRAMEGTLDVESQVGKGSTFSVWLPGLMGPGPSIETGTAKDGSWSVLLYEPKGKNALLNCATAAGLNAVKYETRAKLERAVEGDTNSAVLLDRPDNLGSDNEKYDEHFDDTLSRTKRKVVILGREHPWVRKLNRNRLVSFPAFPTSDELLGAVVGGKTMVIGVPEEDTPSPQLSREASRREIRDLRVLVAEDNPVNQKVIMRLLRPFPCEVILAGNGKEAVQLAAEHELDLIFMDCLMPEMDGLEATKVIRSTGATMPIFAVTANASTDDRDACLASGMTGFLTKPIRTELLGKVIAECRSSLACPAK